MISHQMLPVEPNKKRTIMTARKAMPKKALDLQHSLPMPFYPWWPGAFCVTPL